MAVCFSLSRPVTNAASFLRISPSASALKLSSALTGGNFRSQRPICSVGSNKPLAVVPPQVRSLTTKKEIQDNLKKFEEGQFDTIPDPSHLEHFKQRVPKKAETTTAVPESSPQGAQDAQDGLFEPPMGTYTLPHPIWSEDQLHNVTVTHKPPEGFVDKLAFLSVKTLRGGFDIFSGFKIGRRNEGKWLKRIIFLETVAGVPGMVAAMLRHMTSLRRMQRDHGWIHTLLEEAENERMHLMTALQLKQPSVFFRMAVIGSQEMDYLPARSCKVIQRFNGYKFAGVFVTLFGMCYIVSPRFCHRFVGYLEEEAVKTYTKCLEDISMGPMKHWNTQPAPELAIRYWKLPEDATMRDVVLAIRADEAHHRVVNHTLASMKINQFNPYKPGQ